MDMNATVDKFNKTVTPRVLTVRTRTWTLTLAILLSLVFYIIVNITTRQSINWIDFVLLCVMQLLVHFMYYPDGDRFGQKSDAYKGNKSLYNDKATQVSVNFQQEDLRLYCDYEYEQRKQRYVQYQLGILGIGESHLEELKGKSEKEIKKLKEYEYEKDGKTLKVRFSKGKRKILYNLIFKPLPVEKNHYETIMSAVDNDGTKAIRDKSKAYTARVWLVKIFCVGVIGTIFAYIGYQVRDNFDFGQVVRLCMYLTTLFSTAVTSYTSGETCSRVYRANFYKDLAIFLDGFNEWEQKRRL